MNYRKYGQSPFSVVVVHGGPGATGSVKPLCETLGSSVGVLEPFQTEKTVLGQIEELHTLINQHADAPVILIGHSWGAMLGFMVAASYPEKVKKLILVSSGMLEDLHLDDLRKKRESKLTQEEALELTRLRKHFTNLKSESMDDVFRQYGRLMDKIDSHNPLEIPFDDEHYSYDVFASIWQEAFAMRKRGEMMTMGQNITCEVVAIHGDQDPHPDYAIKASLEKVIKNPRFYTLRNCGHTPWKERDAEELFYEILAKELLH